VLATKTPTIEETPGEFCCEQEFITTKNNKEAVKTSLSRFIVFDFYESYLLLTDPHKNLHLMIKIHDKR
jgi:hypothetical protein